MIPCMGITKRLGHSSITVTKAQRPKHTDHIMPHPHSNQRNNPCWQKQTKITRTIDTLNHRKKVSNSFVKNICRQKLNLHSKINRRKSDSWMNALTSIKCHSCHLNLQPHYSTWTKDANMSGPIQKWLTDLNKQQKRHKMCTKCMPVSRLHLTACTTTKLDSQEDCVLSRSGLTFFGCYQTVTGLKPKVTPNPTREM